LLRSNYECRQNIARLLNDYAPVCDRLAVLATKSLTGETLGGPEVVAILFALFKNDYDFHIRCDAAESLGKLRATEAIEPLIAETVHYSHVSGSAIRGCFNDERSAQCLIELIRTNNISAGVAVYALVARNDARGVGSLADLLASKDPKHQHTGRIAGRFIAQFEEVCFRPIFLDGDGPERTEKKHIRVLGGSAPAQIPSLPGDPSLQVARLDLVDILAFPAGTKPHQEIPGILSISLRLFGLSFRRTNSLTTSSYGIGVVVAWESTSFLAFWKRSQTCEIVNPATLISLCTDTRVDRSASVSRARYCPWALVFL